MKLTKGLLIFGLAAATSQAAISYAPVDENATDAAKKLYNFLAVNYGTHTISGVMTGDLDKGSATDVTGTVDVKAMKDLSGKNPVLVGFDFLFATGLKSDDSWYQTYTQKTITLAKDLWSKGGIPAFTWHWKDPAGAVESYKPEEISFKFENAYTLSGGTFSWNTSSTEYGQLIRDIKIIAGLFKELQDAGVAAIWRPLHEASGNIKTGGVAWFWWGMNDADPCLNLYKLIYDEFMAAGVHNLVWDWNPQNADDKNWNPGNDKYDVISLDLYNASDYTSKYTTNFATLKNSFGSDKIFAVSENGPIPDMSAMKKANTVWSWWMPWYDSWGDTKFISQTAPAVMKANMADPCTITLDEMPGWDKYTISTTPAADCAVAYSLDTLDTTIPVEKPELGDGWMKVTVKSPGLNATDGILIDYEVKEKQTGINSVSIKVKNPTANGVWVGLAIVTDGDGTPAWQWEMSNSNDCWLNGGDEKTCTFDMTTYTEKAVDHPMDVDRIFKYTLLISTEGWYGDLYFSEFKSNVGVISDFSSSDKIFVPGDKVENLEGIYVNNSTDAIRTFAKVSASKLSVMGKNVMLTTATTGNVSIDVFAMNGRRIATLFQGNLFAGTYAFSLADMPKGNYIVRVKEAGLTTTQPVIVK